MTNTGYIELSGMVPAEDYIDIIEKGTRVKGTYPVRNQLAKTEMNGVYSETPNSDGIVELMNLVPVENYMQFKLKEKENG
jgi:hypothetical protein